MDFDLITSLLGGLGGLFGGEEEPEWDSPPFVEKIIRKMMQQSTGMFRNANTIAGSRPGEQAALAQMQAMAGQQAAGQRDNLFAGMREGDANGYGDALKGLGAMQSGQSANINQQMLLEFIRNRMQQKQEARGMLGQAGNLASSSYRYKPQTPNGFASLAPALGQFAYWQTMRQGQSSGGGQPPPTGQSYGTDYGRTRTPIF